VSNFLVWQLSLELLKFLVLLIGAADSIPPSEGGGVIAGKVLMVKVMITRTSISRNQMKRINPWDIVAAVNIDGFQ